MKTSLFLIIVFIVTCLSIVFLGATVFMLYDNCMHLSAGETVTFFNLAIFLKGLAITLPFAGVLSCLFMAFYVVRHPNNPLFTMIVYMMIGICVWVVIIPCSYKLMNLLETKSIITNEQNELTSGYFRSKNDKIVYFSSVNEQKASGLVITNGNVELIQNVNIEDYFNKNEIDPLFMQTVYPSGLIQRIVSFLNMFYQMGKVSIFGNLVYLLSFYSVGLALLSVIGLVRCNKWRLGNVSLMFIFFLVICHFNYELYGSSIIPSIMGFFMDRKVDFLSDRKVLQIILNCIFTLVFCAIGIVNIFSKPDANKEVQL